MSTDVMTPSRAGERGSHSGTGRRAAADPRTAPAPETRRPQRPGHRPRTGRPTGPSFPSGPVRPASPVRPAGPGRPGRTIRTVGPPRQASDQASADLLAPPRRHGRIAFAVLLLGLLGGGLMCLLVVNTTLAANSIQISQLQQDNAATTQRIQQLQQEVAARGSAAVISKEARKLGMRPVPVTAFINLRTHSSSSVISPGDHIPRRPAT
jgi:hypothetical protein